MGKRDRKDLLRSSRNSASAVPGQRCLPGLAVCRFPYAVAPDGPCSLLPDGLRPSVVRGGDGADLAGSGVHSDLVAANVDDEDDA